MMVIKKHALFAQLPMISIFLWIQTMENFALTYQIMIVRKGFKMQNILVSDNRFENRERLHIPLLVNDVNYQKVAVKHNFVL